MGDIWWTYYLGAILLREKNLQSSCSVATAMEENLHIYCGLKSLSDYRYSQLFGEEDADQEVSPDTADPEAECEWQLLFRVLYNI